MNLSSPIWQSPPNIDGSIDAYAAGRTQLFLDISSHFAP
jgi:hypothetical protein